MANKGHSGWGWKSGLHDGIFGDQITLKCKEHIVGSAADHDKKSRY